MLILGDRIRNTDMHLQKPRATRFELPMGGEGDEPGTHLRTSSTQVILESQLSLISKPRQTYTACHSGRSTRHTPELQKSIEQYCVLHNLVGTQSTLYMCTAAPYVVADRLVGLYCLRPCML